MSNSVDLVTLARRIFLGAPIEGIHCRHYDEGDEVVLEVFSTLNGSSHPAEDQIIDRRQVRGPLVRSPFGMQPIDYAARERAIITLSDELFGALSREIAETLRKAAEAEADRLAAAEEAQRGE